MSLHVNEITQRLNIPKEKEKIEKIFLISVRKCTILSVLILHM